MPTTAPKILLVEPDPGMVEMLVPSLQSRLGATVTCVDTAEACIETDLYDPHEMVIAEWMLADSDGLELAEHIQILSPRPVILLTEKARSGEAIAALRAGVCDIFVKPFPMENLLGAAQRAVERHQVQSLRAAKYRRMRELVRHVIRERRDLNRRMELVCKDLVEAQRRLVQRVLALEGPKTA